MKNFKKQLNKKMGTELPESLKKENIIEKLQSETSPEIKIIETPKKRNNSKIWIPLVASLAVVFVVVAVFYNAPQRVIEDDKNNTNGEEIQINTENQSYDDILKVLKTVKVNGYYNTFKPDDMYGDNINGGMGDAEQGEENISFGTTNTQEKDVDESNTILTDGKYIYTVNTGKVTLNIIESKNGKMNVLSTIKLKEKEDDIISNVSMYLYKNYVAVIYEQYYESEIYRDSKTFVKVLDIKDKNSPKVIKTYAQEGINIATRRIDDKIYLVTQREIDFENLEKGEDFIPTIYNNGMEKPLAPNNIFVNENCFSPQYTIIGVVNIGNKNDFTAKAILDDCSYIYSSKDNIYTVTLPFIYKGENETKIKKYAITQDGVNYVASGKVLGTPHTQFSLSEKDGYLRISTTVAEKVSVNNNPHNMGAVDLAIIPNIIGNNVYILDEKLQMVSSITDIAKGEEIKSARYIGDMLYLVTFRQVDPLYAIDLSDCKNPVIKSEIKLPGFNFYLHPISENLLVGIGFDGTKDDVNDNIKVSLFDISKNDAPKEISKALVVKENNKNESAFSMLGYEHKLFIDLKENEFAFPVEIFRGSQTFNCYIRYGIKDNKLYEIGKYFNEDYAQIMGGTFIDNTFYSMGLDKTGLNQIITAYDMTTNKPVSKVKF